MATKQRASTPAARPGSTDGAYGTLHREIVEGVLGPGDTLVETALALRFGVSRTPIREVLSKLQQDGLIEQGPRGMRVRIRTPDEILDIYDVRILLEAQAAHYAAERHTEFDALLLQASLAPLQESDRKDIAALARLSLAYHQTIWRASHSRALFDLLSRLHSHLAQFREVTLTHPGRLEAALAEHEAIVQAILERNAERASTLARSHLHAARDVRLAIWRDLASQ